MFKFIHTIGALALGYCLIGVGYEWARHEAAKRIIEYANNHLEETFKEFLENPKEA